MRDLSWNWQNRLLAVRDLGRWSCVPCSWMGTMTVAVLLKLIYRFQHYSCHNCSRGFFSPKLGSWSQSVQNHSEKEDQSWSILYESARLAITKYHRWVPWKQQIYLLLLNYEWSLNVFITVPDAGSLLFFFFFSCAHSTQKKGSHTLATTSIWATAVPMPDP